MAAVGCELYPLGVHVFGQPRHDHEACVKEHLRVMNLPKIKSYLDDIEILEARHRREGRAIEAEIERLRKGLRKDYEKLRRRP